MFRILFFLVAFAPLIAILSVAAIEPDSDILEDFEVERGNYKGSPTNDGEWLVGFTSLMFVVFVSYRKKIVDFDREKSIEFYLFIARPEGIRNLDQLKDAIINEYRVIENENFPDKKTIEEMDVKASYVNIFDDNLFIIVKCRTEVKDWLSAHNLTLQNQVVFGHSRKELIRTVKNC